MDEKLGMRLFKDDQACSLLDRVTELSDPRSITRVGQFASSLKASGLWRESVVCCLEEGRR